MITVHAYLPYKMTLCLPNLPNLLIHVIYATNQQTHFIPDAWMTDIMDVYPAGRGYLVIVVLFVEVSCVI